MICCNTLVPSLDTGITSLEWAPNTVNQAANQRFVADSDPGSRQNRSTIRAESLAKQSGLAMLKYNSF